MPQQINLLAAYNKKRVELDLASLTYDEQDVLIRLIRAAGFRVVHHG